MPPLPVPCRPRSHAPRGVVLAVPRKRRVCSPTWTLDLPPTLPAVGCLACPLHHASLNLISVAVEKILEYFPGIENEGPCKIEDGGSQAGGSKNGSVPMSKMCFVHPYLGSV